MELDQLIRRYQRSINTIYRSVNNVIKRYIHSDITVDQFSILQFIHQHDQCTSTQIAQSFGIGKSAVTASTNRLYDKNLIARHRDESDRRIVYLSLTDAGKKFVTQIEKEIYRIIGEKLRYFHLTEIEKFIHSLEKLASMMEEPIEPSDKYEQRKDRTKE